MKAKGFALVRHLMSSSGNFHVFTHGFRSVSRCLSTKSVEKMYPPLTSIEEFKDPLSFYERFWPCRDEESISHVAKPMAMDASTSMAIFKRIYDSGLLSLAMNLAIKTSCVSNRVNNGLCIMGLFFKRGVAPDAFTFRVLLEGLIRDNRITEALELFRKIVREGLCKPNDKIYETMVDGLCKADDTAAAVIDLLGVNNCCLLGVNGCCLSNPVDYGFSALAWFFKRGYVPDAFAFGCVPDAVTLNNILKGLFQENMTTETHELFRKIVRKGLCKEPDVIIHGIAIDGFCKAPDTLLRVNGCCLSNRVDYGFSILGWFFKRGCAPDAVTFNALLKGLFQENKTIEAQELFRKIVREGLCQPGIIMYGAVIDGLCRADNTSDAIDLLREMEKGSCRPDVHIYNMVMEGLCNKGMVDSALELRDEMCKKGITPNSWSCYPLLCDFSRLGLMLM